MIAVWLPRLAVVLLVWIVAVAPADGATHQWSPVRESDLLAQRVSSTGAAGELVHQSEGWPEIIPTPDPMGREPPLADDAGVAPHVGGLVEGFSEVPGPCDTLGDPCDDCRCYGGWRDVPPFPGEGWGQAGAGLPLFNLTLFAGIHGFRGPFDVGQNGNFGFHEGLNLGGPLGDPWGFGYQLGTQAVHSDFSGFDINAIGATQSGSNSRQQIFFSGGIFRRAQGHGFQSGVVFDYVHDSYYDKADLQQIRSESALVLPNGVSELGYWGAYGINRQRFQVIHSDPASLLTFRPNDIFAAFYRRHFSGGGQGRLWAGATGAGQAIVGGEATVPLGTSWALENNFVYVIPKTSAGNGGLREETWSVMINLVWYPGRAARTVFRDPFQPLFGVGDNSAFLVRRGAD